MSSEEIFLCDPSKNRSCRRVARWFAFKPKNPNLGTFLRGLIVENVYIYILGLFGIFYGDSGYFITVW
jgi:hypothetical protein